MTVNLHPVTILSDDPTIQGVYSRSGSRLVNFIGGFTETRYGKPLTGGPIQTVLKGVFKVRTRSGAETSLGVEVTEEELPYFERWVCRELGSEAVWDKNAESEVWSLLTENTANPTAFSTKTKEQWREGEAIFYRNVPLCNFDAEIASETETPSGRTFYNVRVTEGSVSRYVQVPFENLQRGNWSHLVGRGASIADGIKLFMFLHGEWQSRTTEERRGLHRAQLKFEKQASDAAFEERLSRI